MKKSSIFLFNVIILFFSIGIVGQEKGEDKLVRELESAEFGGKKIIKYFTHFYEKYYKEDEFPSEKAFIIPTKDINKKTQYFRVAFTKVGNEEKPETLGYYTTKENESGIRITRLSQHVNMDMQAYYLISYEYDERTNMLTTKWYKDIRGVPFAKYDYTWDSKNRLVKLERHGMTEFLNQMELKGFYDLSWKKDKLVTLTNYDKMKFPVERYHFTDSEGFSVKKLKSPIKADRNEYGVGNKKIFIRYLKKYERFKSGSDKIVTFYINYKSNSKNELVEEKYNKDDILLERKIHPDLPKQAGEEEAIDNQ